MVRRPLGLDLGTKKCGWAVLDSKGERVASGVWSQGPRDLVLVLPSLIVATVHVYGVTDLAYEQVAFHQSVAAGHAWGEMRACVRQASALLGLTPCGVNTATIKKAATGNGAAKKPVVVQAAAERWGIHTRGEDEAEALWTALTYLETRE